MWHRRERIVEIVDSDQSTLSKRRSNPYTTVVAAANRIVVIDPSSAAASSLSRCSNPSEGGNRQIPSAGLSSPLSPPYSQSGDGGSRDFGHRQIDCARPSLGQSLVQLTILLVGAAISSHHLRPHQPLRGTDIVQDEWLQRPLQHKPLRLSHDSSSEPDQRGPRQVRIIRRAYRDRLTSAANPPAPSRRAPGNTWPAPDTSAPPPHTSRKPHCDKKHAPPA